MTDVTISPLNTNHNVQSTITATSADEPAPEHRPHATLLTTAPLDTLPGRRTSGSSATQSLQISGTDKADQMQMDTSAALGSCLPSPSQSTSSFTSSNSLSASKVTLDDDSEITPHDLESLQILLPAAVPFSQTPRTPATSAPTILALLGPQVDDQDHRLVTSTQPHNLDIHLSSAASELQQA
ncbi:hypothetical protein BG004_004556 [Podila humilis]|nr:hypothetical protein BG004_004556 [Podila humilis]